MLIKRAVIDKIGGMDDRYGLGNFEDDDFSLRAALAGFESWIAGDCFVHHFGSRTFVGAKIDYRESLHKNWVIFKKKWGMPQELPYGSPYSISHIPNNGFDPAKHYYPLSKNDILPKQTGIIPESPEKTYSVIQQIITSGNHEKAIIALEKLLESYPDFSLAHNDLGVLYFNKREKEKALNHYEKAALLEPNNITFHKNLSDFYYVELGRLEEALQGYVHVLSINPKDVETLLIVGHICVALHKFDDAQVFYSRVLDIEPENVDARQNLDKLVSGQLPVVGGQPEQDSVALKPASFLPNQENDKKNEDMESQQEASSKSIRVSIIIPALNQQKLIKKCVKNIQDYTPEPYEIIFVNKGAKSSALKWLRSVVKENENYQLVELEKGADFARCYNEGIEASSGEYIVLLHCDVVVTEGWLSGLLKCTNSAPDAGIVGPMTNNANGVQKVSDSDDISIDHLEEFAKSFRQRNRYCRVPSRKLSEFCLLFRRELMEKIGPFDESLGQSNLEVDDICLRAALEGYMNIIAGDVFVYKYNGSELIGNKKSFTYKWNGTDAQSSLGKKLLALNAMDKAVELDEKGQIDDAVKILTQGVGHVPDEKRLYHALAEMLINNKQFKDALDALNELPPDDQDVKKLELTGYCMEGMEQYKEAEEYADHTLSLDAVSALALNLKGVLAYRQGDNSMAEDFFNRAIASDPGFGEPYTNLGALKWAMGDQKDGLDLYERGFILSPTIMDIVTIYHSAVTDLGAFEKAEPVFRDASVLHPNNRRLKFLLIDIIVQLGKHDLAMEEIEGAMIAFGIDDGILSAAIKVRDALGPMKIENSSGNKGSVSLCMIVKNEEQHLEKCLMSVKPVVDEMIVVDTGSTDMTRDIATAFGAKVYDFEWKDDFSGARNYSISKASGDWILVMDADEVISPFDYGALRKLVKKSTSRSVAYSFVTRNYSTRANTIGWAVNDGKYGAEEAGSGWMPSTKVRLFHNVSHIQFEYPVHEKVEPSLKNGGIDIKKCNVPVHHYGQLNKEKSDINTKGEAYYHMGRNKLEELGDDVVAIRELAVQAGDLGKHDEAIELWQRLVAIKPDMPVAYVNMGTAY
ncbi:MAG: glycosyltransferase, partial [Deltaproteobacteria bacterium]|nr:glycosyltransferase [Deltaproteobacteria bacterium]